MPDRFTCTWCGTAKRYPREPCPADCDRPSNYNPKAAYAGGRTGATGRRVVLTPLGWQAAGYVAVEGGWRKGP